MARCARGPKTAESLFLDLPSDGSQEAPDEEGFSLRSSVLNLLLVYILLYNKQPIVLPRIHYFGGTPHGSKVVASL
jgi:hypothetical protein